jgi:copper(I)-binding protein
VRGTVATQKSTGAFMRITSAQGGSLVGVSSPVAGVVQVHEMKMDGGVMKMGAVDALALPAGQAVELKPGGYHVMLMDLKQPLKAGDTVPLTLTVKGKDGKTETVEVKAPVRALGAPRPCRWAAPRAPCPCTTTCTCRASERQPRALSERA